MSFNIDKITKEYPRAWKECMLFLGYSEDEQTMFIDTPYIDNRGSVILHNGEFNDFGFHYRRLYDYFDSVGIVVATCLVDDDTFTCILYKIGEEDIFDYNKKIRTETEYRAFEKAFEIYEKQLKGV